MELNYNFELCNEKESSHSIICASDKSDRKDSNESKKMPALQVWTFQDISSILFAQSFLMKIKHWLPINGTLELQFDGLKLMREWHTNCLTMLEFGGIGLFYEFYFNKSLEELLATKGSVLSGRRKQILVSNFYKIWQSSILKNEICDENGPPFTDGQIRL